MIIIKIIILYFIQIRHTDDFPSTGTRLVIIILAIIIIRIIIIIIRLLIIIIIIIIKLYFRHVYSPQIQTGRLISFLKPTRINSGT